MKFKINLILITLICFIIYSAGAAEEKREININRMSLKDCVDLGILGNYLFKAEREQLLQAVANLRVESNLSFPSVTASATMGENMGQRSVARNVAFNLIQDLNTGDQLALVNNAYTQSGFGQSLIYNQFSVVYTKPFLKNGGFAAGNYNIASAGKTLQIGNLNYEIVRQDLIRSIILAFYTVIKNKNLVLIYEESVRAAKKDWKSSIDSLAVLIGFKPEDNIDIKYDYSRKISAYDIPEQDLIKEAMQKRLEIAKRNLELDKKNLSLKYYKNQFLPELNLVTSYNTNPDFSNYGISQSYLLPTWSVNLNSTYYFRDFQDEENMKTADRLVVLQKEEISNYKNVVADQVRNAMRDASSAIAQIEISFKNVEVSKETFRLAEERWSEGKADNRDVMDAQKDINSAKISYYNAQINYLDSKAKLLRYIGEDLYKYIGKEF